MEISSQYTVKRYRMGKQPMFCEQGPDMCDSIQLDTNEHKRFILRNPVHSAIQNTPIFSANSLNTVRSEYTTSGANHSEGGWQKDINIHDPEATERYRKKIQKDDGYIHAINALHQEMDHLIMQNNAIEMYQTYFREIGEQPELEKRSVRTVNEYSDQWERPISSICWQPEGHRIAIAYVDMDFYRNPRYETFGAVWDTEKSTAPELLLQTPYPIIDLKFNHRDPNLLAGGLSSGQVGTWDRRKGSNIQSICEPHCAHRDIVRSVFFINSKSGMEMFSGSSDGVCKWWDLRNLSEPTDEMIMSVVNTASDQPSMVTANGIVCLEFEPTIPTRFMIGSENGLVLSGNRKGKTALEKVPAKYDAHDGPVWSVQRNPSFLKNFLTVGDWTFKIWSEECRESPILWSPPLRHRMTAGSWSPTRASLMVLTDSKGCIVLWDLLRSHLNPVLTLKISSEPLLRLDIQESGHLMAVGNKKGVMYLVELSHNLTTSDKNDKSLLQAILERETKRERILEGRLREIRLKQRQTEEGEEVEEVVEDPTVGDKDLIEANNDYLAQVRKEWKDMGVLYA